MGWNWAVWFVQQMLDHLWQDEAGETTLRHLSPTADWDALSQTEADESLARMLRRLEAAEVMAREQPSTNALLGLELVGSGHVGGHRPRNSGALRWLFFGRCRRTGTQNQPNSRTRNVSVRTTT